MRNFRHESMINENALHSFKDAFFSLLSYIIYNLVKLKLYSSSSKPRRPADLLPTDAPPDCEERLRRRPNFDDRSCDDIPDD